MGSTLSAPCAYLQKHGCPWIGIPASLEIFLSCSVKDLKDVKKYIRFSGRKTHLDLSSYFYWNSSVELAELRCPKSCECTPSASLIDCAYVVIERKTGQDQEIHRTNNTTTKNFTSKANCTLFNLSMGDTAWVNFCEHTAMMVFWIACSNILPCVSLQKWLECLLFLGDENHPQKLPATVSHRTDLTSIIMHKKTFLDSREKLCPGGEDKPSPRMVQK